MPPAPIRCCLAALLALVVCLAPRPSAQSNVLVIVADDLGVDRVGAYAEHPSPGRTPNIDALARRGILFRNAWANPACSPSRASLLTGRHAFRHRVGAVLPAGGSLSLAASELTIPEMLAAGAPDDWTSIAIGKWHLGGPLHPLESGFALHAGSLGNLAPGDYFTWSKALNGTLGISTQYATSAAATDASRALRGLPEPWFCWLAFNAPHKPYHAPPDALHTFDLSTGSPTETPVKFMKADTQAMDTEIGRLLGSLPPGLASRTTIVFVGDNGTDAAATTAPFVASHAKGSVFEGGINVPFIVAGPPVRAGGQPCDALVSITDLFATVAELAHVDLAAVLPPDRRLDSVSLLPYLADPARPSLRRHVYSEIFTPVGAPPAGPWDTNNRAVRDERFKLIRRQFSAQGPQGPIVGDRDELYDLLDDPFEHTDLLAGPGASPQALAAYAELAAYLERLRASED